MEPALYYESLGMNRVRCHLCPHHCHLATGQTGLCGVRYSAKGKLYALSYGRIAAYAVDPIEKKPLFHYCPGSQILSVGSAGCNLDCDYCQNHQLVQGNIPELTVSPAELVERAQGIEGNVGVAFTYNEPLIAYEYVLDAMRALKEADLKTVLVSNGYVELEPLEGLIPYLDAANIDLKGYNDAFYQQICKGHLDPVLRTIDRLLRSSVHVEISILLIDGLNAEEEILEAMFRWIAERDPLCPVHLNRYYPAYRMTEPATGTGTLERAMSQAKKHLSYVYMGNFLDADRNTYCHHCGELMVERDLRQATVHLEQGYCSGCGQDMSRVIRL